MQAQSAQDKFGRANIGRLALGTVQFGMAYGVTHEGGRVADADILGILRLARSAGIDTLDTAAGYGEAEAALGRVGATEDFTIVSKLASIAEETITPHVIERVAAAFERSLATLGGKPMGGLLVHDLRDLAKPGADLLWQELERLKRQGHVARIGISAYDEQEIRLLTSRYPVDLMQLPMNVLDQRLDGEGVLDMLAAKGVAVHVRSAFLQGLLLIGEGETPARLAEISPALARWRKACRNAGVSQIAAALGYLFRFKAIERVVVGVQRQDQLSQIIAAADVPMPAMDWRALACDNPVLVDPRKWPKA